MSEEKLKKQMDEDMDEIFKTEEIINFMFDLVQKAYLKGIQTGMKIKSSEKQAEQFLKENEVEG